MSGDNLLYACAVLMPLLLAGPTAVFFRRFVLRREKPRRWTLLVVGNLLVSLTLLSLLFLGFETYYRFFFDETVGNNLTKVSQRWFERHWHQNYIGLRDNIDYSVKKTAGTLRVTFLGDSFTAGHGIQNVEERFVNRIRAAMRNWEVHAIAVCGINTNTELLTMQRLFALGYEIDLVVLVWVFNDISDFAPEVQKILARWRQRPTRLQFLFDHSYFLDLYRWRFKRWAALRDRSGNDYLSALLRAYQSTPWQLQQSALRHLKEEIERRGGRLLVVSFPSIKILQDGGEAHEQQRSIHVQMGTFWNELRVPHLDLLPVLEQHRHRSLTVNRDDDHPNEFAHRVAGEEILHYLKTMQPKEKTPSDDDAD